MGNYNRRILKVAKKRKVLVDLQAWVLPLVIPCLIGNEKEKNYNPKNARISSTLSVFSQVNSGSSRPKCPYAAVFR